jgi:glutathione synthetase
MKKPFWLFVTDPWKTLDHPNDTTLRLMEAASRKKISVFWASQQTIRWEGPQVLVDAYACSAESLKISRSRGVMLDSPAWTTSPRSFQQIHYRVDPPVDLAYLHPLQMLAQCARRRLVNPAESLVLFSEKTIAAEIPELFPETCVSSSREILESFVMAREKAVLKPLHLAQSKGITLVESSNPRSLHRELALASEGFTRPILLQEYLPEVATRGETRLWFVDGRLLASVQKLPARGEFVINMDRGGSLARVTPSRAEKVEIRKISKTLRKHRIRLAAVDWISGKITDFNVTSPGLIVSMEKLLNRDLASKIVAQLLR